LKFGDLLARADEELLQQLAGRHAVRLLVALDETLTRPASLRRLILGFREPIELLRDGSARNELLALLPPNEAIALCITLGVASQEPYTSLADLRLRRGSRAEEQLLAFFDITSGAIVGHDPEPDPRLEVEYGLFEHQRNAVRSAAVFLEAGARRCVLHMPTGSGKTRTALNTVARELRSSEPKVVIWLAHSEELCGQAVDEFREAWSKLGDRPVDIYRYWGDADVDIGDVRDGFFVAGLSKLYSRAKRDMDFLVRLADRADLVIIDEAHQAIAETYRFLLDVLVERNQSALLGLTATPGRTWNDPEADARLADFFARQKVTLTVPGYASPVDYLVDEGYLALPHFESLTYAGGSALTDADLRQIEAGFEVPDGVLRRLAEDEQRNLLVVRRVEDLLQDHSRVLVFAATVEHARLLATVLAARGRNAAAVTGQTDSAERRRLIAKFRAGSPDPMVLCNFGVLTTGFDAPRTSAAVIARPTTSLVLYSQMVGRATRGPRAGGNAEATIVTLVDTAMPGFGRMQDAFSNWEDVW
jgi:DNA repair protein RadD